MKKLTSQQSRVLKFVDGYSRHHGFPPTIREIGDAVGLANVNAARGHLAALEKKGRITRIPDKARSICVVRPPSRFSRLKRKVHKILRTDEGVIQHVVYGLALTTWDRRPCLVGSVRDRVGEAFEREAAEHGWELLDQKIEPDHIVVVAKVWHNHSPTLCVRRLRSAGEMASRPDLDDLPDGRLWAPAYAVTTDLDMLDDLVAQLLATKGTVAE